MTNPKPKPPIVLTAQQSKDERVRKAQSRILTIVQKYGESFSDRQQLELTLILRELGK